MDSVTIGYHRAAISEDQSVTIPDKSFTVIVGPNARGKSALLRALARLTKPGTGQVVLDGSEIAAYIPMDLARRLGLLPQTSLAPEVITVADLVARGRFLHQGPATVDPDR